MSQVTVVKFIEYTKGVAKALAQSPNVFWREKPERVTQITALDWEAELNAITQLILKDWSEFAGNQEQVVGTIGFELNDTDFDYFVINYAETNEYQEWLQYDVEGGEVDLGPVLKKIFSNQDNWIEHVHSDLSIVQKLLLALVETAAELAVTKLKETGLKYKDKFIMVSAEWHDVEKGMFFDSSLTNASDRSHLYRTIDYPPDVEAKALVDTTSLETGRITIMGMDYDLNTNFFRSDEAGWGKVPPEIGLFTKLHELKLSSEALADLPEEIFTLSELEQLDLSKNRLVALSDSVGRLKSLKQLNLSNNSIAKMPTTLNELKNLTNLDLTYNALTKVIDLEGMDNLDMLSLYHNQIQSVGKLPPSLAWLNLTNNNLSSLPKNIGELKNLKTLVISNNAFTKIPDVLLGLTSLESLELGGNPLDDLPLELSKLPNLKQLRVYPNRYPKKQRAYLKEKFGEMLFVGYDTSTSSFMPGTDPDADWP